jgi:replicative DNA helicase
LPTTTQATEPVITTKRRENIILSSFIFNKECREYVIQNPLDPNTFDGPDVKKMIGIFNGLIRNGIVPSLEMLVEQHYPKDENEADRNRLIENLNYLKNQVPPVEIELFKEHLFLLKKHRFLSLFQVILLDTGKKIQEELRSPSFKKEQISVNYLQSNLEAIFEQFTPEEIKSLNLSDGLTKQFNLILERRKNPELSDTVTSGYDSLDEIMSGGFRKGNFSLICARPAMGKTVTMLNLGIEAAKKGKKVLFISIEMDLVQCLQRVFSKISSIKMKKILQPDLLHTSEIETLKKVSQDVGKMYGKNFFIEEVNSITSIQLESRIKFYQKHFGVELVFVDYIQIMRTREGKQPKETSDFSSISADLRELSKALGIALVLGAQLSRDVEKREDKRPMDSDLKNSGSFEQDACTIIHLYRDSVYNPDTEDKNILEIIIGKNRFGTGNVNVRFGCDYSTQSIGEAA